MLKCDSKSNILDEKLFFSITFVNTKTYKLILKNMKRIVIFASGSGTNAENIIRYFQNTNIAKVTLILSNNKTAKVLERAENLKVPFSSFTKRRSLCFG